MLSQSYVSGITVLSGVWIIVAIIADTALVSGFWTAFTLNDRFRDKTKKAFRCFRSYNFRSGEEEGIGVSTTLLLASLTQYGLLTTALQEQGPDPNAAGIYLVASIALFGGLIGIIALPRQLRPVASPFFNSTTRVFASFCAAWVVFFSWLGYSQANQGELWNQAPRFGPTDTKIAYDLETGEERGELLIQRYKLDPEMFQGQMPSTLTLKFELAEQFAARYQWNRIRGWVGDPSEKSPMSPPPSQVEPSPDGLSRTFRLYDLAPEATYTVDALFKPIGDARFNTEKDRREAIEEFRRLAQSEIQTQFGK